MPLRTPVRSVRTSGSQKKSPSPSANASTSVAAGSSGRAARLLVGDRRVVERLLGAVHEAAHAEVERLDQVDAPRTIGTFGNRRREMTRRKGRRFTTIPPPGGRTAVATAVGQRIMTPSSTAWPPTAGRGRAERSSSALVMEWVLVLPVRGALARGLGRLVRRGRTLGRRLRAALGVASVCVPWYLRRNLSTRPAVSMSFCLPV